MRGKQIKKERKQKKIIRRMKTLVVLVLLKTKPTTPNIKKEKKEKDRIIVWETYRQNETIHVPWKDSSLSAPLNSLLLKNPS